MNSLNSGVSPHRRLGMDTLCISDNFYQKILKMYAETSNEEGMLPPDDARTDLALIIAEELEKVVYTKFEETEWSDRFLDLMAVVNRGTNPFQDEDLRRAGVPKDRWNKIVRAAAQRGQVSAA